MIPLVRNSAGRGYLIKKGENMGDFEKCQICKEFDFLSTHKCAPEWEVVYPENGDPEDSGTYYKAFGIDEEDALDKLCHNEYSDWDYPEEFELWIRKPVWGSWLKFDIYVQSVPEFRFTKKE